MAKRRKYSAEQITQSAILLTEIILANRKPEILDAHLRRVLGELIWKTTEADGKHNTAYWSEAAIACADRRKLVHEHVITKKDLIDQLLAAEPTEAGLILNQAVACIVTTDEHNNLSKHDKTAKGWRRYDLAEVRVVDRRTGKLRGNPAIN